jgi:Protein of unknown function (DUF1348)
VADRYLEGSPSTTLDADTAPGPSAQERRIAVGEANITIAAPPFTLESATQKVRLAENSWNSRDPEKVSLAYTPDSRWRNRSEFITVPRSSPSSAENGQRNSITG